MKRLLALLLSLVLMLGAAVPAYATGDGNFDGGGGGMGSGTSTNYWNPGMDAVRISVVNVDSHAVVGNTVDWSNQNPSTNMIHFGKVSKLSYNSGRALSPVVGGYVCVRPAQSLPRIISTGDYPASIAAIRSYFTDEQVIRAIAGYVGIDFDTLIADLAVGAARPCGIAQICFFKEDGQRQILMGQRSHLASEISVYLLVIERRFRGRHGIVGSTVDEVGDRLDNDFVIAGKRRSHF